MGLATGTIPVLVGPRPTARVAGRSWSGCRSVRVPISWPASKGRSAWRAFLSGRRTGEPGQQIRHNGDLGADQAQQPHEVVRAQLPFRPRSPRNRPCLATRGGTREPGGWRPGCGATWVMAAPAAHLCRQAMSRCGRRPGPQTGRWPRWPASCWPLCRSPNEPIVRGGGSTAWRGSPELRSRACQLRRARLTLLPSNVRPAADSSPIPTGMGRQQPKTRTRR